VSAAPSPVETRALIEAEKFEEADSGAHVLVDRIKASPGQPSPELAEARGLLVNAFRRTERSMVPALRALAGESLRVHESAYGPDDPRILPAFLELGDIMIWLANEPHTGQTIFEHALAFEAKQGAQELAEEEESPARQRSTNTA